ncbi:hypothetical protein ACFOPQ_05705 [Deinococcus antarcticus]|uniref:Uncharacterized protein n=1 Tax=Deinococcus antarcticus TaxID=1298767 RepID=A0ABV8A746_9DEIO
MGKSSGIVNTTPHDIAQHIPEFPYPLLFNFCFSAGELKRLDNPTRRVAAFENIISQASSKVDIIFVPHMPTVQDKADLYKNY